MWYPNLWLAPLLLKSHKALETTALERDTTAKQAAVDAFRETLSDPFTLKEVDSWYEEIISPQRTVGPGTSKLKECELIAKYRLQELTHQEWWPFDYRYKLTNEPDPNGECGAATMYVLQEYDDYFPTDASGNRLTSQGLEAGGVVWYAAESASESDFNDKHDLTHASVIMIDKAVIGSKTFNFVYDPVTGVVSGHGSNPTAVTWDEIKGWHVYDLFEAKQVYMSLEDWWLVMCQGNWGSGKKTSIMLGLYAAD